MENAREPLPAAAGELIVRAPPEVPRSTPANPVARLLPVVMVVAMVGMMVLYFSSGSAAMRTPMFSFFPVMMLASAIGTLAYGARGTHRTAELNEDRREYLRYLDELTATVGRIAVAQHHSSHRRHPRPDALWTLIGGARMWERAPADPDFGHVRVGLGGRPLTARLVVPELAAADRADPVTTTALRRLIRDWAVVPDLPVSVPLFSYRTVTVDGADGDGLLRAMICQLAVLHAPDELRIATALGPSSRDTWDWLKWLPHHQHPHAVDATGPVRLVYRTLADAVRDRSMSGGAQWLVIADGVATTGPDRPDAMTVVVVHRGPAPAPDPGELTIRTDGATVAIGAGDPVVAARDDVSLPVAVSCARRLAACPPGGAAGGGRAPAATRWLALMGIDHPGQLPDAALWSAASGPAVRPIRIGVSDGGSAVELDINEAAQGGMGPHGLCVGATGSGKSEFLRTLVLGMLTAHPPDVVNLILVDFKGGATFLGLERAPHVSAVITNLAREAHLVARMHDALSGEMNRRQELLRTAGNAANVVEYAAARRADPTLPVLPALLIVVDEFSELLAQHPDFADLFVAVGRLGRSLGMHLLLASQRVDEGRLRGLETHLSYRICLKTFSAAESRAVLGVPDAYHLPGTPGAALLKTVSDELVRFHTAYVSGPVAGAVRPSAPAPLNRPLVFRAARDVAIGDPEPPTVPSRTLLDAVVDRLAGHGPPAHPVWLAPLDTAPPLSAVLSAAEHGSLCVPIGVIDCPFEQRRMPLTAMLADSGGNVAVVGGPRSGKSTTLRTLVLALAATHDPRDVQVYCLDFGGGTLASLSALPHVGAVAGRADGDLIRRILAVLERLLTRREARFRTAGIDSMAEYRRRRATPQHPDDPFGDVFLVIDGLAVVRQEFDVLEARIAALAAQGLSYGIHVVVAASRWADIRPALKDQLGTRIELRLGDPADSEMDRKRARNLVNSPPGRGITRDGRELVIAVPRLDEAATCAGLVASINASGQALRIRYQQRTAPRIELLPLHVDRDAVLAGADRAPADIVLGIGETDLEPVIVDFAAQPHLVVLGEGDSGKTATLRTLCREIMRTRTAAQAHILLIDVRRSLLGVVESDHLAGYAMSVSGIADQLVTLTGQLTARLPGDTVTQRQLRDRSWWSGPEFYVVIDDYDLVADAAGSALTPLHELLPHAADIGLHVVVARRSGGAARAMFDPVLARMRDLGAMALVLSTDPEEGTLWGSVRPRQLPPGRGTWLTRSQPQQLLQVSWTDPP